MDAEITPEIGHLYSADTPPDPLGCQEPGSWDAPLVLNGRRVDARTAPAKRFRALCLSLSSDLGGRPSTAQSILIRTAAALSVQCEVIEHGLLTGGSVDVDKHTKLVNTLGRVLAQLGLQRQARDITQSPAPLDAHTAALLEVCGACTARLRGMCGVYVRNFLSFFRCGRNRPLTTRYGLSKTPVAWKGYAPLGVRCRWPVGYVQGLPKADRGASSTALLNHRHLWLKNRECRATVEGNPMRARKEAWTLAHDEALGEAARKLTQLDALLWLITDRKCREVGGNASADPETEGRMMMAIGACSEIARHASAETWDRFGNLYGPKQTAGRA